MRSGELWGALPEMLTDFFSSANGSDGPPAGLTVLSPPPRGSYWDGCRRALPTDSEQVAYVKQVHRMMLPGSLITYQLLSSIARVLRKLFPKW